MNCIGHVFSKAGFKLTKKGTLARPSPRHGARYCSSCQTTWHRDVNAARNIMRIFAYLLKHNGARPQAFVHKFAFSGQ